MKRKMRSADDYYLLNENTPFSIRESFNTVRTNLTFVLSDVEGCRTVTFSSALPGEGKSSLVSNLALSLAESGLRVLIVDADLRSPVQHKIFGVQAVPGLSDVLADFSQSRCVHKTAIPNLMLLPAGNIPPNPSELLASKHFDELIAGLSASFDYILIDTPPCGVVSDAMTVASRTRGMILVARYNRTDEARLEEVRDQLNRLSIPVLGMTVQGVKSVRNPYRGYSYGEYGSRR